MPDDSTVPHVREIRLTNFRGFKSTGVVTLAPLTFLVGPNSSGKSSLANAILLVAQSPFAPLSTESFVPTWIGPLVDLGSFRDTVFRHKRGLSMRIEITVRNLSSDFPPDDAPNLPDITFEWKVRGTPRSDLSHVTWVRLGVAGTHSEITIRYRPNREKRFAISLLEQEVELQIGSIHDKYNLAQVVTYELRKVLRKKNVSTTAKPWVDFLRFFNSPAFVFFIAQTERVSSGRAGPLRWYPLSGVPRDSRMRAAGTIDRIDPEMLSQTSRPAFPWSSLKRPRHKPKEIGEVLNELDIGNQVRKESLSAYHSAISVRDNVTGISSNLADIGYGASQVMPVAAGCASESAGPLFVEQPEIHLHPKAQGTVAELLARTSKRRQVIIETHSEHMINRARILVAEGELDPNHVAVIYVARDGRGSRITPITIRADGEFAEKWPEGFFDERYADTMTLLNLKTSKKGSSGGTGSR